MFHNHKTQPIPGPLKRAEYGSSCHDTADELAQLLVEIPGHA
jgi:hypothetical protein